MKYLTKEWCDSQLDDIEIDRLLYQYRESVNSIFSHIPFPLKTLYQNLNLHDGILKSLILHEDRTTLVFNGIFGDLERGYYFLDIIYKNVQNIDFDKLAFILKDRKTEILSDEIAMSAENHLVHRILFNTTKEIEIHFLDVEIVIRSANALDYRHHV